MFNPNSKIVNGYWSKWSQWSPCTKSCASGMTTRDRTCTEPQNGGKPCPGNHMEITFCNTASCPIKVDGNWTQWSQWSQCSQSCEGGLRSASRSCSDPEPMFGGEDCVGNGVKEEGCNDMVCPGKNVVLKAKTLFHFVTNFA